MEPQVLADRYELVERLGAGGMAVVWKARDRLLGREVAVKVLHPGLSHDADFVERFRREARHAASLSHANVAAVYDTGDSGTPFIVMELVDGSSLHRILKSGGPMPVQQVARVARAILAALGQAHARGLVHRDVKPGNVLVASDGTVKVTDFGIAKGLEEVSGLTQTGTLMGTASYLSPEQASGQPATPASDLYGTGCLLYECLTGTPPFTGDTPVAVAVQHQRDPVPPLRERRPDVPAGLEAVVNRALEKDPARRYASAAEMDAAIAATGLDLNPDEQPTVLAPVAAAPTVAMSAGYASTASSTQVIRRRQPPPSKTGRILGLAAVGLAVAALLWLAVALVSVLGEDKGPEETTPPPSLRTPGNIIFDELPETPEPTPAPTPRPTPKVTATPTVTATPEVTPLVTPTRTLRVPRTPVVTPLPDPDEEPPGQNDP